MIAIAVVSLVSLIGIVAFFVSSKKIDRILIYLVSLSVGTLLGGAFLHLVPEAFSENGEKVSYYILLGLFVFFVLEKFIHWNHCHDVHCEKHSGKHKAFSYNILLGDSLHNLIDGMIIASSFLVSPSLGIATTVAVIFHEIPQELGDFGVLVYSGFSKLKAMLFNFLSALVAVVGGVIVLLIGSNEVVTSFLVPFTAGGFIYIALADLIPELHKSVKPRQIFGQLIFLIIGVTIMVIL